MGTIALGAVAFIVMIAVVVGVHEGGHFAAAKASGIRVDEFAIGFGPRLLSRRRGDTVYSVRALPIGGFVKMPGMSALEDNDGGERGFMSAPLWRKLLVLLAGVTMNFLLAGILFGVLRIPGSDALPDAGGAAATAGLVPGDRLTAVAGVALPDGDGADVRSALHTATTASQGRPIPVTYRQASTGHSVSTSIRPSLYLVDQNADSPIVGPDGTKYFGMLVDTVDGHAVGQGDPAAVLGGGAPVTLVGHELREDTGGKPASGLRLQASGVGTAKDSNGQLGRVEALWLLGYRPGAASTSPPLAILQGIASVPAEIGNNVRSIWDIITTPHSGGVKNFQGPVGIARDSATAAQNGWTSYIGLAALFSVGIGIINVLPIPPFDGGRVVIVLGEALRRRRAAPKLELALITAGVLLIGMLALVITVNDVKGS